MTDAEIIDALSDLLDGSAGRRGGGMARLADRLGESTQTVFNWKTEPRGISWRGRPKIAALAAELGVAIPADFLAVKRPAAQEAAA